MKIYVVFKTGEGPHPIVSYYDSQKAENYCWCMNELDQGEELYFFEECELYDSI